MGTNYYWTPPGGKCETCGHVSEELHIGKSSAGWCFALHIIPSEGLNDLPDWVERWKSGSIRDECGDAVTAEDMYNRVTKRGRAEGFDPNEAPWGYNSWAEFNRANNSEIGPNNLFRHRIGPYCQGHGDGTWDLMTGDFS